MGRSSMSPEKSAPHPACLAARKTKASQQENLCNSVHIDGGKNVSDLWVGDIELGEQFDFSPCDGWVEKVAVNFINGGMISSLFSGPSFLVFAFSVSPQATETTPVVMQLTTLLLGGMK
jgi:hypothetical protein